MSWFRLDDKSHGNAKVIQAGNAAWGLWCRCGAWSADHLTDGFIPAATAGMYGTTKEVRTLVTVGLWDVVDGGYLMPDYLDFNPSKEKVEAERAAAKERMRSRRSPDVRANTERTSDEVRSPRPDPTRPDTYSDTDTYLSQSVPGGGEPVDKRRSLACQEYGRIAAERATTNDPDRYALAAASRIASVPDLDRWLEMFPTAPPDAIAAWLHGDKGSMRYYPRADELAPVIALRENA